MQTSTPSPSPSPLRLLALETATDRCAVAVAIDGEVIVELTLDRPRSHAEQLVPLVADALRYADLEPGQLDVVAVSSGPGSYTGLRIGASTAKGLAVAAGAALVPVPSLEALAYAGRDALQPPDVLVAAFDARRDEVFAAAFQLLSDGSLGAFRETAAVVLAGVASWLGKIEGDLVLAGDGGAKIGAAGIGEDLHQLTQTGEGTGRRGSDPANRGGIRILPATSAGPSAAWIARLATKRHAEGRTVDPSTFEPFYLKDFVAKRPTASAFEKLPF